MAWRWIDSIADWLRDRLGARAQLRAGILCTVASLAWTIAALLWTDEPPNVIAMSGVALIFTGIGIVVGAQVLEMSEGQSGDDAQGE